MGTQRNNGVRLWRMATYLRRTVDRYFGLEVIMRLARVLDPKAGTPTVANLFSETLGER